MAMSGSTMGDAVAAAIKASVPPASGAVTDAQLKTLWEAACTAIVAHIMTNAVVTVPATGIVSPTGPCSGSATGTIS